MMNNNLFNFDEAEEARMRRSDDVENLSEDLDLYRQAIQAKENAPFGSSEEKKQRMEFGFCASRIRNKKRILETKL